MSEFWAGMNDTFSSLKERLVYFNLFLFLRNTKYRKITLNVSSEYDAFLWKALLRKTRSSKPLILYN